MVPVLLSPTPKGWVEKTDIYAYARRQAQSCEYLKRLFEEILGRAEKHASHVVELFDLLLSVHRRQYADLVSIIDVPSNLSRTSYYFDSMYAAFGLSPDSLPMVLSEKELAVLLSIQGVSYLRGRDRYELLQDYQSEDNERFVPVWRTFCGDAMGNAEMVFDCLNRMFRQQDIDDIINSVVVAEDQVMRKIWRR